MTTHYFAETICQLPAYSQMPAYHEMTAEQFVGRYSTKINPPPRPIMPKAQHVISKPTGGNLHHIPIPKWWEIWK